MKNKNGFSLVEVSVAMGLVGVSMLAVSALMTSSSKSLIVSRSSTDFNNLLNMIATLVASSSTCTNALNLSAAPISVNSLTAGAVPVKIYNNNTILAQPGTAYGSVTVSSLNLVLVSNTPTTLPNGSKVYQARLPIQVTRTNNLTALSDSTIFLSLVTDPTDPTGSTIKSCGNGSASVLSSCPTGQALTSTDGVNYSCTDFIVPEQAGLAAGGACATDGAAAHDASGALYICHAGTWMQYTPKSNNPCALAQGNPNFDNATAVTDAGGVAFCKLHVVNPAVPHGMCPNGMHQYVQWSTTSPKTCTGSTCIWFDYGSLTSCTTGMHGWSSGPLKESTGNPSPYPKAEQRQEFCQYLSVTTSGTVCNISNLTCWADLTYIGCINNK